MESKLRIELPTFLAVFKGGSPRVVEYDIVRDAELIAARFPILRGIITPFKTAKIKEFIANNKGTIRDFLERDIITTVCYGQRAGHTMAAALFIRENPDLKFKIYSHSHKTPKILDLPNTRHCRNGEVNYVIVDSVGCRFDRKSLKERLEKDFMGCPISDIRIIWLNP